MKAGAGGCTTCASLTGRAIVLLGLGPVSGCIGLNAVRYTRLQYMR